MGNPQIKMTTSIIDYIFRELAISYLDRQDLAQVTAEDLRASEPGASQDLPARRLSDAVQRGIQQRQVAFVREAHGEHCVPIRFVHL